MRRPSLAVQVVLLALCTLALTTLVQAQYRTSIQGVVTDPTGAVVSGATLTLTNPATGEKWVRTSNDVGVYNFNALAAAPFRLEVAAKGFKTKVLENVVLIPEQPNALDVQLELGNESTTVSVNADTIPAIDTETASINGVVSSNQIQHMPSFGRDVMQLIQLAPGVFGDGAQGSNGGGENIPGMQGPGATGGNQGIFQTENGAAALAVGQQYESNSISIDGISTTSAVWGGTTVITPTEDSIDNVKVLSNGYDAEYGRFSGAQIQITSKGGSNDIHGSLFFLAHRPNWNAFQRYNGQGNMVTRDDNFFDQFGGSVGGPIWKNKIFAFFAYETVRTPASVPSTSNGWYDTSAFDGLAPSGSIAAQYLTFPGSGVINKGINATATCATAGLVEGVNCATINGQGINLGTPLTTGLGTQDLGWTSVTDPGCGGAGTGCGTPGSPLGGTADIANYITVSTSTSSKAQYNGRLDADVTGKDRIGFAIYWVPQSSSFLNGPARQYNFFHHSQVNDAFSAIWNHTFSPTLLNEVRVNAAGWRWNEVTSNPQSPVGLPSDTIGQIGTLTGSTNIEQFGPNVGSILNQWTYSYKDVATKIYGRHTIKFGGEVTRLFYLQDCAGCGVPSYSFFNMWDFLNDAPHTESSNFNPNTGAPTTNRQDQRENIWGIFVQDDLKVRPNLTLNLGLRYSYFGSLSSKQDNMYRAIPGAGSAYLTGLAVRKDNSWNPEKDDFGPEIGFAWSPTPMNNKMVFRGGYGVSFNQEEIAISANISNNPGLVVSPTFNMSTPSSPNPGIIYQPSSGIHDLYGYPANPNAVSTFNSNGLPSSGAQVNISLFPQTLPTTLVHHYSFDMQYDVGHQFVASLGYLGTVSRNIYFHQNPNATPAALGFALNPQIGGGDYWGVNGHANYNAMLATVKHQFSHQFMTDAEFTWAKSMDTSSGPYYEQPYPYDPNLNYGRSDYNVAKAFKLYGVWQPVIFRGANGWMEKIVGGWSLSGIFNWHSGFPWSPIVPVSSGSLYCGTCGYTSLFPAAYLGGAGSSTSNDQFKTGSNYPNGGTAYFSTPTYTAYSGSNFGNALPQVGVQRNSLNGPGYRDLDATITKGFGLPKAPVLGEGAKAEIRLDFYNVFNTLNFNPTSIVNDITATGFGRAQSALAGRVMTLGARFSF
jgi:Carboxypeptidase regulatory-like domain/TonB dependent receptor